MGEYTCIQIWRWEDVPDLTNEFISQTVDELRQFGNPVWVIRVEETLNDSPVVDRVVEAVARREVEQDWDDKVKVVRNISDDLLYLVFAVTIR